MLTRVDVRNAVDALFSLPLEDTSSGFSVKDIEGLDPVKATLVSSSFANADGKQYHNSRREERNIKIKLGLEATASLSVRDLRTNLYQFFMPKSEVSLRFFQHDETYVDIVGRVETCEAPLFTKDPAVDISLMCFDPDFYDPTPESVDGMSTASLIGVSIPYVGTVETGIVFTLYVEHVLENFTIYHTAPDGTIRETVYEEILLENDIIKISTVPGDKYVTRERYGVVSPTLYSLTPSSNWIELQPGTNHIRVFADGVGEETGGVETPFNVTYVNRYGGL